MEKLLIKGSGGMRGLTEADMVKMRQAFEENTLGEAIATMEQTLEDLGYRKTGVMSRGNLTLSDIIDDPISILMS